jgi:hypothetical protein
MRKLGLLCAAVAATLLITSCSAIPGFGGSQSGVEACAAISDTLQSSATEFANGVAAATTDPSQAAAAFDKLITDLTAARAKVTNADVVAALDKATAASEKLAKMLKAAGSQASSLDSDKFSAASEELTTALSNFTAACTKV